MFYHDTLYGPWNIPPILEALAQTDLAKRARGISMGVFPNRYMMRGILPSRFHHGMGVARLMHEVLTSGRKRYEGSEANLWYAACLLHDFGNPPFAHLCEPVMKRVLPHAPNGESHLKDLLPGSETERVLLDFGVRIPMLMDMIMGASAYAHLLHGSMDLDNLDNVARYAHAAHVPGYPWYNPLLMAQGFTWNTGVWTLDASLWPLVAAWQQARAQVYGVIYDERCFAPHIMLRKAIDAAFAEGALDADFFRLDDEGAISALRACTSSSAQGLIADMDSWTWFPCLYSIATQHPNPLLAALCQNGDAREELMQDLVQIAGMQNATVGFHIGKGRDTRDVHLATLEPDGSIRHQTARGDEPRYRARLYVSHRLSVDFQEQLRSTFLERIGYPDPATP